MEIKEKLVEAGVPATTQITLKAGQTIPNGQTSGEFVVVNASYPDRSSEEINVKVIVAPAENTVYNPTASEVVKKYNEATTSEEVINAVDKSGLPTNTNVTLKAGEEAKLPNGQTSGTFNVIAEVTYPDGSKDEVTVPVKVKELEAVVEKEVPETGDFSLTNVATITAIASATIAIAAGIKKKKED